MLGGTRILASRVAPLGRVTAARSYATSSSQNSFGGKKFAYGVFCGAVGFGMGAPFMMTYARERRSDGAAVKPDESASGSNEIEDNCGCDWRKKAAQWDSNWDKRENEAPEETEAEGAEGKKKFKGSRHIILIRHGHYMNHSADDDKVQGLSELGTKQVTLAAERLQHFHKNKAKITSIVHSDMQRVKDTAGIISKHLPDVKDIVCDPNLKEGMPIPPIPKLRDRSPVSAFVDGPRIEHAFRKHFYRPRQEEDTYEIIVGHGNVIRYFVCRALQIPPEAWLRMSPMNASITTIVIRPSGRCSLHQLGDTGHIPAEMVTFN